MVANSMHADKVSLPGLSTEMPSDCRASVSDAIVGTFEISGWHFTETPYKIDLTDGETPTHSELAALGAAVGLFHHVLHRKTSSGSGKSRRMGNLLEDILAFEQMDYPRPPLITFILRPLDDAYCGVFQRFKRWFNKKNFGGGFCGASPPQIFKLWFTETPKNKCAGNGERAVSIACSGRMVAV